MIFLAGLHALKRRREVREKRMNLRVNLEYRVMNY